MADKLPNEPDKPKPTIDKRLDELAQTVELMAAMQQDSNRRIDTVGEKIDKLGEKIDRMAESINILGRLAGLHEERLDEHNVSLDQIIEHLERSKRERRPPQQ